MYWSSINILLSDALNKDTTEQHAVSRHGNRHGNSHGSSKQADCQWPLSNLPIHCIAAQLASYKVLNAVTMQKEQACRRTACANGSPAEGLCSHLHARRLWIGYSLPES